MTVLFGHFDLNSLSLGFTKFFKDMSFFFFFNNPNLSYSKLKMCLKQSRKTQIKKLLFFFFFASYLDILIVFLLLYYSFKTGHKTV